MRDRSDLESLPSILRRNKIITYFPFQLFLNIHIAQLLWYFTKFLVQSFSLSFRTVSLRQDFQQQVELSITNYELKPKARNVNTDVETS